MRPSSSSSPGTFKNANLWSSASEQPSKLAGILRHPSTAPWDQFHLGRIRIPDTVTNIQIQNKLNNREAYLEQAQLERETIAVQVNSILLNQDNVLRTAEAEASLLRSRSTSEATRNTAETQINGTNLLFELMGIEGQYHATMLPQCCHAVISWVLVTFNAIRD